MIKNDLRVNGFSVEERIPKKSISTLIWVTLTLLLVTGTIMLVVTVVGWIAPAEGSEARSPIDYDLDPNSVPLGMIAFVLFMLAYYGIRFALTFLFCHDRYKSIRLKTLEDNHLPVCHCREALKVWQTVVIYIIPIVIVYVSLLRITGFWFPLDNITSINFGFLTILIFMSFFLAFDLTLVIYVLFIKVKDKIDYIAVDYHIYRMTLYRDTYVRTGKKGAKRKLRTSVVDRIKSQKRMFVTMTTCLNLECDNYSAELDRSVKICPLCGEKIYKAEILQYVVTCINENCENYGQELKTEIEKCTLCGRKTGKLSFKFTPHLTLPSIAASLISSFVYIVFFDIFDKLSTISSPNGIVLYFAYAVNYLWYGCIAAGIVMGFLSKKAFPVLIAVFAFFAVPVILEYML